MNTSKVNQPSQLELLNTLTASQLRDMPHHHQRVPRIYEYDNKLTNGQVSLLKLWGMWYTPSLPLLPGPLRSGVVAPVRITSMRHIELFNYLTVCKQMIYVKLIY